MMARYRLALAGALLLLPQIAVAEEPVETALREKVAAIDALPDWSASYGWLNYDPSTDTATLIDFVARTETLGTEISIAKLTVDGYSASPDGSFTVKSVLADGGVVKLGFATIEIGDLGIENLFVPLMDEVAFVPSKPLTSMVKLYGEALKARFDRARVGSVAVVETLDGVETRITYDHLRLDGFGDGKLASMRAGPIRMESPSPQGLVNTTIGSIEGSDMDLAAFVRVYDPDLYAGGVGDMVWHQGIGVASYNDVEMDMTGIRLLIDSVVVDVLKGMPISQATDAVMQAVLRDPMLQTALGTSIGAGIGSLFGDNNVGAAGAGQLQVGFRFALDQLLGVPAVTVPAVAQATRPTERVS